MRLRMLIPSCIVWILIMMGQSCWRRVASQYWGFMMKSRGKSKSSWKNPTPLTTATPTESSAPSSTGIHNSNTSSIVAVGTLPLSPGTSESVNLSKTSTVPSLAGMVSLTAVWTYWLPPGAKTTNSNNGNHENANSMKHLTGMESRSPTLLVSCTPVSSARRTRIWLLREALIQIKLSCLISRTITSLFVRYTICLVKLIQWTFRMMIRCLWSVGRMGLWECLRLMRRSDLCGFLCVKVQEEVIL